MKPLNIRRKYDNNNRLIYELKDNSETIIKYDEKGNTVYEKEWDIESGEIWVEYYKFYNDVGNLIHFKDVENMNEYWIEYNDQNKPICQKWSTGEAIIFEYDEKGNVIRTLNENGIIEAEFINDYK